MDILADWEIRPHSATFSRMYSSSGENASHAFEVFWWLHVILVLGFLNYLPFSKHLHVITSVPNVYFSNPLDKRAQLATYRLGG
ncbi:hypothetical protein MASR1M107_07250 [Ignavibacteriales bacterium]